MYEDIKVCECKDVYLKEILELINSGISTVEEIQDKTCAGTVCKMCVSSDIDIYGERPVHIEELLKVKGKNK